MRTKKDVMDDCEAHALHCEDAQKSSDPNVRYNPDDMRRTLELLAEADAHIKIDSKEH
jgi:hypothetical protein